MRSKPVKQTDEIRILGFGDSVINGGTQTEQDSLSTTVIEKMLTQEYKKDIRCFNISYGSWGPDNCFSYLEEYGDFNAGLFLLVVSSHDAYDNMTFEKIVDIHPSFPSKQYKLALYELLDRYLIPYIKKEKESHHIIKGNIFNSGFLAFYNYTQERRVPFFIYLHPDKAELIEGKYDYQGNEIIKFCTDNNIFLLRGLECEDKSGFRDGIHLNEHGQRMLAEVLLPEIKRLLNN
ncbi:hypothetical protein EZS27_035720 [termite gut metagenome]|uniref:SGNH hydrolase-type esterase domain-containing protein n=1 Tax=termite gut metagenome TaxID=433724 RepID=A0A5J4PV60_9ZZZZ